MISELSGRNEFEYRINECIFRKFGLLTSSAAMNTEREWKTIHLNLNHI